MKIAVFTYSQSGQAKEVAEKIFDVFTKRKEDTLEDTIIFKTIIPEQEYPFPWSKKEFFDTFPETRLGLPPSGIKPIDL
jgi:hypothetical protein